MGLRPAETSTPLMLLDGWEKNMKIENLEERFQAFADPAGRE